MSRSDWPTTGGRNIKTSLPCCGPATARPTSNTNKRRLDAVHAATLYRPISYDVVSYEANADDENDGGQTSS